MRITKYSDLIGIGLILATGLIHGYLFPDEYGEAAYLGLMFLGAFVCSIFAAIGIYRREPLWGWGLGALIALGSIVGYVLSRTVGLPISGIEPWGPPIAYLSLLVEVLFLAVFTSTPRLDALKTSAFG